MRALLPDLICFRCGAYCCPACAFALDSATYCLGCAEAILEAEGLSLNLSHPGRPADAGRRATADTRDHPS